MGITPRTIQLIERAVDRARSQGTERPVVLFLGYPDILGTPENFDRALGPERASRLEPRPNADATVTKTRAERRGAKFIPSIESLAAILGFEVRCSDFARHEGSEVILDLNDAPDPANENTFDIIVDPGTCEHIFHIGNALTVIERFIRVGGSVIHLTPVSMGNHGFYNVNPVLYIEFYHANGFVDIEYEISPLMNLDDTALATHPGLGRFKLEPECAMHFTARRVTRPDETQVPIQSHYTTIRPPSVTRPAP
ncbi:MAG: hypothetical protein AAGI53_09160 [Planctomycetota bacterium]